MEGITVIACTLQQLRDVHLKSSSVTMADVWTSEENVTDTMSVVMALMKLTVVCVFVISSCVILLVFLSLFACDFCNFTLVVTDILNIYISMLSTVLLSEIMDLFEYQVLFN